MGALKWKNYNADLNMLYLFRFVSHENLFKFLNSGNIWFSRSDKFGDKMECVTIADLSSHSIDFDTITERKKRHLMCCFHYGNHETLALWDTYARTDDKRRKFALRFDRVQLVKLIEEANVTLLPPRTKELVHGKVEYKNLIGADATKLTQQRVRYPTLRKEAAFAYEMEYRFVVRLDRPSSSEGFNLRIGDPSDLPFSILVNPLLDTKEFVKCYREVMSAGFEENCKLSALAKWVKPEVSKAIITSKAKRL